jgi:hypothetical protein
MKAYKGHRGKAQRILKLGSPAGKWLASRFGLYNPRERSSVPNGDEAFWAQIQYGSGDLDGN